MKGRGLRNCRWIEEYCRIPEGRDVGKPVKLRPWQKDFLKEIYDQPANRKTRRAIISMGRKNAKTALSAFLLLLHLCGPEARANSQLFSAAQSRDQAGILFSLAAKMVRMSPDLSGVVVVRDTAKQLFCPELGTLYRALSAEASTAYGLSPVFIVHDELGQVKGPRSELYEALETATGAQDDPLSIIISTQAPTEADLLSVLIDDALTEADPHTRIMLHSAPVDMDPFSDEAIRLANPAFGDFQNADEVRQMAEAARRMPSREAEFRNLVLNQRVEARAPFISRSVWQDCAGPVDEDWSGLEVYGGLDLSEVNDLTALVLIAKVGDAWQVRPRFWLPEDGISERSRKDRVPYDQWAREGHISLTPGATVSYDWVAEEIAALLSDLNVRKMAFDRWNWRHFRPCLERAGLDTETLDGVFEEFGQGFKSMSPALRDLEGVILNRNLAHGGHPVLTMCAANAVVQSDPSGNRKLSKIKSHGRIDGMVSLAMAISVAATAEDDGDAGMDDYFKALEGAA